MGAKRIRTVALGLLAWLFLSGLWTTFNGVYNPDMPWRDMVVIGLIAGGNASILAVGVWWLTGRIHWPNTVSLPFLVAHLLASLGFGFLWIVMGLAASSVRTGRNLFENPGATQLLGWRMLMGIFLYGLVAGGSYAIRMHRRLVAQERVAAEARALAAEARLQGLRSQIHPHFLFNALHTVSALVRRAPDRARLALQQLGDLLRYSLDGGSGSDGMVPLEREWVFTEDYLELERLRLSDRLRVVAEIAPDAAAVPVPVFCVQTLVENAVRHAVAPSVDGATVRVSARLAGGTLKVEVSDDGPGPGASSNGSGLGLRLLAERLEGRYGKAARLTTEAVPEGGFRASLRLPATGSRRGTIEEPAVAAVEAP